MLSREDHAHSSRLVRVRGRGLNEANAKRCAVRPKHVAKCIPANAREQCDRHAESRQVGCDIKGCASGMCCNRLRGDDIATPFWKVRQRTCIHVAKRVAHDEHGAWTSHIYIVQGAANLEGIVLLRSRPTNILRQPRRRLPRVKNLEGPRRSHRDSLSRLRFRMSISNLQKARGPLLHFSTVQ